MSIKGHRKSKKQKWAEPWPRKQILKHTEGNCPYCNKSCRNLEEHTRAKHIGKKKKEIRGLLHGHN